MLPNKRLVATVLLCLLAVPLPQATAFDEGQPPFQGRDLVAHAVTISPEPVVGVASTITVEVKNRGNDDHSSGYTIRVGDGSSSCITGDGSSPTPACERRFLPTDAQGNIPRGSSKPITFTWTPRSGQAGQIAVVVNLSSITPQSSSPPDDNGANNHMTFQRFVHDPGVRVDTLREAVNRGGADPGTPWDADEIRASGRCRAPDEPNPKLVERGCVAQPGDQLLFEYRVVNTGNSADTYTPRIESAVDAYVRKGYRFTFNPPLVDVPVNQSRIFTLQIDIPLNASSQDALNVGTATHALVFTSKYRAEVNTRTQVIQPTLPSLLVGERYGLAAHSNESLTRAFVGAQANFSLILNNTGNAPDTYRLRLVPDSGTINDTWGWIAPWLVQVPAGQSRNVSFSFFPPVNASMGHHAIDLEIQSLSDDAVQKRMRFTADLQQHFALQGGFDLGFMNRYAAEKAEFVLRLHNAGNGPDTVDLDVQNVPFDWTWTISPDPVTIPPFTTRPVWLNVTAPPNTAKDTEVTIFVNATSKGPVGLPDDARVRLEGRTAAVRIKEGPNIQLVAPPEPAYVDPGASTEFRLTVRNTGNVADNFTIGVRPDDLLWAVTAIPEFLVLEPTQAGEVVVRLRAPASARVGETTRAFVNVDSQVDLTRKEQATLSGKVSGPDPYVSGIVVDRTHPYAGDPMQVTVTVGNAGNKAPGQNVTLDLYAVKGGVETPVGKRVFSPGELPGGRRLAQTFTWDDTIDFAGSLALLARIDGEDLVAEIDESQTSNQATLPLVLRTFDIRITRAEGLSGRPGERVSYADAPHVFLVEYRGNQPTEPVRILVSSENGWASSEATLTLPQNSPIAVLATVDIPAVPGVARDTLTLTVVPQHRPQAVLRATAVTTVVDDEKPEIRGLVPEPALVTLGGEVAIVAHAFDATGLSSVTAFVVTPQNETRSLPLAPAPDGSWRGVQAWREAGVHRVWVEAIDNAVAPNSNSTRATLVEFTVSPGSAPAVKLADGQKATIRTGAPLKLNVTDPLGVARVAYTVRGITYELRAPYEIDTSAWTAGVVDLQVSADNLYGVRTTERFTVTVDNQIPAIRRIALTPESPKVNEDAVLRIETDPKVTKVEVALRLDGRVVETREATPKGAGVFELLLNPGEGRYAIDVTATDEAGNAKVEEGAVVFSAKPASPIPAPGLLVALAALALTALARRRP